MATTITALFDSRSDAEAAKERLKGARVDADHVHLHDKSSMGYRESGYSNHEDRGFWDSVKNAFAPDEDRHTYEEGVRRGGTLLTADVDDDCIDEAVRVLEEANTVDIEDRSNQWRSSGWDYAGTGAAGAVGGPSALNTGRDTLRGEREEVIPIVEENLVVGKRDVSRGGVRVRSYVSETPVHEQIRLRNERVNVERRSVDLPLSAAEGDAFRERSIDMTATGEEAVVGKNARVVEEVVVSKTAEEHVESIDDTVRRTDVEIDRDSDVDTTRDVSFGTTDKRL
ncbi:YsnF/AvaK domain-containing protein [Sphingomonas sp. PL-96]|uniref:YsnF/AvaK domain-containing protein n=1 Tax=Sphingomonas sp. PL-96 TaxID=2887201 RepID=UPI001E5FEE21|nr:YsnF/AvaK domain-containing protein [Sphingomonas sp. PL-96]MCC2976617.1 YsnF/AvaK domain-containing protein [Sphingomonas sp. PL-96]